MLVTVNYEFSSPEQSNQSNAIKIMGRGKNIRRRATLDGPAPICGFGVGNQTLSTSKAHHNHNNLPLCADNSLPKNPQEIEDAIEFHWKNLSLDLKKFLLKNPQELSLRKFVDYWTAPCREENTSPNIAASLCGCSWYLALNYMSIRKVVEARALILNGCFLQQCYNKPIKDIVLVAKSVSGEHFREKLPFFTDGLLAISSEERMSTFLRNKVSSNYQRRMSFATQTEQTKKQVQVYVNQISSDWDTGRSKSGRQRNERRRRATMDDIPADSFIEIKLVNSGTKEEAKMSYGLSMPLKSLFKKYAEDRNLSLRQLRFSYKGKTLFLSSVGNKSPQDLGIQNLDSIIVKDNAAPNPQQAPEEENSSSDESKASSSSSQSKNEKRKGKKYKKQYRRASWSGPEIMGEEERLKLKHSRQLSRVFTEVAPQFEQIRQKLNALNLCCTPPKVKKSRRKAPIAVERMPFVNNPKEAGKGGKAGVPFYAVHVGEADNLYKITKPIQGKSHSIDLHGMTKEEALKELDAIVPEWINIAMRGAYPWVMPAVIICGGGNQILSEAVDQWIKSNDSVAKAPKKKFSRRRTVG